MNEARIRRCDFVKDREALALVAGGWHEAERLERLKAIWELVRAGKGADFLLWGMWEGERLLGAIAGQELQGRCALVWPPQVCAADEAEGSTFGTALLKNLCGALRAQGVHLAQALLSPEQGREAELLAGAGFALAARLLYMTATADCFPANAPQLPFAVEDFQAVESGRLAGLIEETYAGTKDCPHLDGKREVRDVVAGYMEVGEFRAELWKIVRFEGRDVGCLLMNLHPQAKQAEIVYVAVTPEFRGRSFGIALTRYAQWLAKEQGCEQVILAVDAANEPAIRVYAAAGFRPWTEREVWVQSLREFPTQAGDAT